MKSLLTALLRAVARIAASEAGELLSVRRKTHLLEAARYARIEARGAAERQAAKPLPTAPALSARCARGLPARHAH